jgi:hypothetical protein
MTNPEYVSTRFRSLSLSAAHFLFLAFPSGFKPLEHFFLQGVSLSLISRRSSSICMQPFSDFSKIPATPQLSRFGRSFSTNRS